MIPYSERNKDCNEITKPYHVNKKVSNIDMIIAAIILSFLFISIFLLAISLLNDASTTESIANITNYTSVNEFNNTYINATSNYNANVITKSYVNTTNYVTSNVTMTQPKYNIIVIGGGGGSSGGGGAAGAIGRVSINYTNTQ